MTSIKEIVPEVQLDIEDNVVVIELVCSGVYEARVLFEDLAARIGGEGLVMHLRGACRIEAK